MTNFTPESTRITAGELHLRLLEQFAPPSIVVTEEHTLVHVSENAGRFLHVAGGEPSRDVMILIHPALGWMLFIPANSWLADQPLLMSMLWAGLPLVAIGYWIGRRARRRARRAGRERGWSSTLGEPAIAFAPLALLLSLGLGIVPLVAGQRIPPGEIWIAAIGALLVGVGLGVHFALHRPHPSRHSADAPVAHEPAPLPAVSR